MRPTMADVAEYAGVSITTVSLVLNDKPGVSGQVRNMVMRAVNELGYHLPERHSLRNSSDTKTITVIHFAPPGSQQGISVSGISASYMNGIQDYCQSRNVNWALIANYHEGDDHHVGYHLIEGDKLDFDGLILLEMQSDKSELLQQSIQGGVPIVVLSREWTHLPVSIVSQSHCQQANQALDLLVDLGHRKIAFLGRESEQVYDWFRVRLGCYKNLMTSLNLFDPSLIAVGPSATQSTRDLIARQPDVTAIFAINDRNAVSAMRALRELGIDIPQQVSVIGLDDSTKSPPDFPQLTTVAFPHYKVGHLAAEILLRQIEDPELFYTQVFVQSHLVERESCAPVGGR
ncbi:MAG: LacI family DNA-binding transcriptional regulator [Anaerolineae bacterium]|nr:LacI family DNA-binding transcriptional regulator [Anaerolineae bacterium]